MRALISEIKKLDLPQKKYLVVGGSALELYGIRKAGDIDLMVSPELYDELKAEGWKEIIKFKDFNTLKRGRFEVSMDFRYGTYNVTPESQIEKAILINGIPTISLDDLVKYKKALGREKDIKDIKLIETFLSPVDN